MKNSVFPLLAVLFILSGCGSGGEVELKPDSFSEKDLCIERIDDVSEKVCYGDQRSDVEKVLNRGKPSIIGIEYDFGVAIAYRDEVAVGIILGDESKEIYQTIRGIGIGASKEEIKNLYGKKYAIEVTENNLDYIYDSKNKKFLGKTSVEAQTEQEEMKSTLMFSAMFESGNASSIMLFDRKMAVHLD